MVESSTQLTGYYRWADPSAPIRVGTRGSSLAVAQAQLIADALAAETRRPVELCRITTYGDVSRASLVSMGGMGVFATELRCSLLKGDCDVIVHSLKDLPVEPCPGLCITAYPEREDPCDVLCSRGGPTGLNLASLPSGARVGSGSPRRICQLKFLRPDLEYVDIRGNVATRLKMIDTEDVDAVVLAAAGLKRLDLFSTVTTERFDPHVVVPAAGQGCLAVEIVEGSNVPGVAALDHLPTHIAVLAEREVLLGLGAGCHAPVGVCCFEQQNGELHLLARVSSVRTTSRTAEANIVIRRDELPSPCVEGVFIEKHLREFSTKIARRVLSILEAQDVHNLVRESRVIVGDPFLLIPRDTDWGTAAATAARKLRWQPLICPLITTQSLPLSQITLRDARGLTLGSGDDALTTVRDKKYSWAIFTSRSSVEALDTLHLQLPFDIKIACVGAQTADVLQNVLKRSADLVPSDLDSSAAGLTKVFARTEHDRNASILWVRGTEATHSLPDSLEVAGFYNRDELIVYTTFPTVVKDDDLFVLRNARSLGVLLTSGSCARSFFDIHCERDEKSTRIIAIGKSTAKVCESLGISCSAIATAPSIEGLFKALGSAPGPIDISTTNISDATENYKLPIELKNILK